MASGTRVRCRRTAVALLACMTLAVALAPDADASPTAAEAPAAPGVQLVHQTPVVSAPRRRLNLTLTRSGPAAAPGATVTLTLYSRLTTRSGLLAAIGAPGPVGGLSATPAIRASCFAVRAQLRLAVTVAPNGVKVPVRPLCGHRAPVLRLGCTGGCDGVYPLRITITGGGQSTSLVTLVTYASRSAAPLRVAWVMRIAGASRALAGASGALRAIERHPLVPVTIDVQGSAIASGIAVPGATTSASLLAHTLRARAHELIGEPYVPADLGALRASHLPSEVIRQFALNGVVLLQAGVRTPPVGTVTYGTGPQTPTMANAVASVGVRHLLVDGGALSTDPASTLSWGGAFRIQGAPHGPSVLSDDTQLAQMSASTTDDPGLVAAQFLGELAFLHFEQPFLPDPRAVVVVTTATPSVAAAFVDAVLVGLKTNAVLAPVTASEAFSSVPVGANGFPAVRSFTLGPSGPWPGPTVSMIRFLRITTDALSSAVIGGTTPIPSIEGELLSSEVVLPAAVRSEIFTDVHNRLKLELGNFHIDSGSITLTESAASLPITILSHASYTIAATLRLSGRRLSFPDGSRISIVLPPSVRSWRVSAQALTSGDLPLTATLISPDGRLVITRSQIIVRATPTSIVGIALTVGAVLVLALWWLRTSRRRRRAS
jgi:hypothetical protein